MNPRGWGGAHLCEEVIRVGGETMHIVQGRMYSEKEYLDRSRQKPGFDRSPKQTMVRNPHVFARGKIRHPDHATIILESWHRVFLNVEVPLGIGNGNVGFLD